MTAFIEFHRDGDSYIGRSDAGRTWRITAERTGWRLAFSDAGDQDQTNAGVHRTAQDAMAEARR